MNEGRILSELKDAQSRNLAKALGVQFAGLTDHLANREFAAIFVERNTVYRSLGLDCWDIDRDARRYAGARPVIAHPPCKRWGRYWSGGPSVKVRRIKGDDDGCFASALFSVRTWGGVIEHPEASAAWDWFGLERPAKSGGWTAIDKFGGRSCCVEQGHYGHRARKATWLYAVRCEPLDLKWGPAPDKMRMDPGFHSAIERQQRKGAPIERLSAKQRLATPLEFAEKLLELVRGKK